MPSTPLGEALVPVVCNVPTTAADVEDTFFVFKAPDAGEIIKAYWANGAAVTANATNYVVLTLKNGSTTMATLDTATVSWAADTAYDMTMSTTDANCKFAAGDSITLVKTDPGTGGAVTAPTALTLWIQHGRQGR